MLPETYKQGRASFIQGSQKGGVVREGETALDTLPKCMASKGWDSHVLEVPTLNSYLYKQVQWSHVNFHRIP
jgi:hypothetical protein